MQARANLPPIEIQIPYFNRLVQSMGSLVSLVGLMGGLGYLFNLPELMNFIPGLPHIAILTAVAFMGLGLGVITIIDTRPYPEHPRWLWPIRWASVIIPGLIGLACVIYYFKLAEFNLGNLMLVGRSGPLIPTIMTSSRILLASIGLLVYLTQPRNNSILVFGVCPIGFYLIYTSLFALAGHGLHLPLLYNYMISIPACLGFLLLGGALLIGSIPYGGSLGPLFLPDRDTKIMGIATLLLSLLVLAYGTATVAFNFRFMQASGLSLQIHHLFINAELSTVLIAVLVAVISLRVVYYRYEALQMATRNAQVVQELAENQGLLNRVIKGCDDGIWDWDIKKTDKVFWNDRTYEILDIPKGDSKPSAEMFYNRLVPEDRDRVRAAMDALIKNGTPYHVEYKIQLRSGDIRYCLSRGLATERDEQGKVTRISGTVTDIGRLKQAEQALLDISRKLAQSNQDLEQFAAVAAHDLQAPLRKVRIFMDMIRDQSLNKLDGEALDLIERSRHSIEGMQTLISDLLVFAQLSQEVPLMQRVNLSEIMKQVLQNLDVPIKEKNAQLTVGEMVTLMGDQVQLTQLMQNLVENALKYQPPGQQPVITIQASCFDHKFCQITVQDNGIGFKSENAERIFQPFNRLHGKASPYPGTGVGLAICKRITERHGGTIQAQGEEGKGAQFTIRLPLNATLSVGQPGFPTLAGINRPATQ